MAWNPSPKVADCREIAESRVVIEVPCCRHCGSLNIWAGPWKGLKCKDCGMIDTRHPTVNTQERQRSGAESGDSVG